MDRVDALHRKVPPVAVLHAVLKKYGEDRGGQLATLLAYRGFFSLFPLLLAFVGVLGLLLAGDDELREDLVDSALSTVPVIGSEISKGAEGLSGSFFVVVGSILVSLWAGLGLLDILQESINTVWGVPHFERPPWILRRLRDIPGALLIAVCVLISGAARWLIADGTAAWVELGAGALLPILAGGLAFVGLHLLLGSRNVSIVALLPGALACGLGWWGLQALGGLYIDRIVRESSDTYGVFVVVFGLLSWCYVLGMLFLYSAELSVVLLERRWPRSLSGRDLTDQDQRAFSELAAREVRVRGTEIAVEVPRDPEGTPPAG